MALSLPFYCGAELYLGRTFSTLSGFLQVSEILLARNISHSTHSFIELTLDLSGKRD